MRRDLRPLTDREFDLLVVGAGVHGAFVAWDACLRGLSVAAVDQGDFGAATSANSLRIIHGGLRELTRGDFTRMRASTRECATLLRLAPHLVRPLPVVVPLYGGGARRLPARAALGLHDLLSRRGEIPPGRLLSRDECLRLVPWCDPDGLAGGVLWHDGHLLHPERLTVSFLLAAADQGAVPANYVRADGLLVRHGTAYGVRATDLPSAVPFEIRARVTLVAAGPWTRGLVEGADGAGGDGPRGYAFAMNVVLARRLAEVAVGLRSRHARRYRFLVPAGESTSLGTWYMRPEGTGTDALLGRGSRTLLDDLGAAAPALGGPALPEVARCQWGWVPLKRTAWSRRRAVLADTSTIVDQGRAGGPKRVLAVEGVKYTTARRVAERAVDRVFDLLGRRAPRCRTAEVPLRPPPTAASLEDEVVRAVECEMAVTLADIVFRRTALGQVPGPRRVAVVAAARAAAPLLGWDAARQQAEIDHVMQLAGAPVPA